MGQEQTVRLRGGSRDGDTTAVDGGVRRLLATSDAPGMLEVYEDTGELVELAGNTGRGVVFAFVGHQAADEVAPESQHSPPG